MHIVLLPCNDALPHASNNHFAQCRYLRLGRDHLNSNHL